MVVDKYRSSSMKYSQSPSAFAVPPFISFHLSPRWLFCCGSAYSFFIRVPHNARNIASYVSGLAWLGQKCESVSEMIVLLNALAACFHFCSCASHTIALPMSWLDHFPFVSCFLYICLLHGVSSWLNDFAVGLLACLSSPSHHPATRRPPVWRNLKGSHGLLGCNLDWTRRYHPKSLLQLLYELFSINWCWGVLRQTRPRRATNAR